MPNILSSSTHPVFTLLQLHSIVLMWVALYGTCTV